MARGSQNLIIKGLKCINIDIVFTLYVPNIAAWFCSDAGRKKVARRSELERMDWKKDILLRRFAKKAVLVEQFLITIE